MLSRFNVGELIFSTEITELIFQPLFGIHNVSVFDQLRMKTGLSLIGSRRYQYSIIERVLKDCFESMQLEECPLPNYPSNFKLANTTQHNTLLDLSRIQFSSVQFNSCFVLNVSLTNCISNDYLAYTSGKYVRQRV